MEAYARPPGGLGCDPLAGYQLVGLVMGPLSSWRMVGNWLALRGPARSGLYQLAALLRWKFRLPLGSNTPTCLSSFVRAMRMGSSRSESLEITTARSYSLSEPSINR